MLKNVAPLGYNPSQHFRKPDKGNPLVKWLAAQDPANRYKSHGPEALDWSDPHADLPRWCRPDTAGQKSLKLVTESFYTNEVKPAMDLFLQKCFLRRPADVVPFACEHFLGHHAPSPHATVSKKVSWAQYEQSHIQPARLFLIQPLVHLLLQARPPCAKDYIKRVFQVYSTLSTTVFNGEYLDGVVPMHELGPALAGVLWSITDDQLSLLNSVLSAVQKEDDTLQLIEFAIRVPLEISEKLCDALVHGKPKTPAPGISTEKDVQEDDALAVEAALKQQAVDETVLKFEDDREAERLSRIREELDDVLRAARLAIAFPRTVDEELFDDCPEADREAQQLRDLVQKLSDMQPQRRDWCENELPALYRELTMLAALPPRTAAADADDGSGDDERLLVENAALREIVTRGVGICEVIMSGLGPKVERQSAGNQADELLSAARLQAALPRANIQDLEDEEEDIFREIMSLRGLVDRVAEAQLERKDWLRIDAPALLADVELFLALPKLSGVWDDYVDENGPLDPVVQESKQLTDILLDAKRVITMLLRRESTVPEPARAAVAAAQLFEQLPSQDLDWLEAENEEVHAFVVSLRGLVGQVADAQLDRPRWVEKELPSLVAALRLQTMMKSNDIVQQLQELEHDELSAEVSQIEARLEAARSAFNEI